MKFAKRAFKKAVRTFMKLGVTRGFAKLMAYASERILYVGSKPWSKNSFDRVLTDDLTKGKSLEDRLMSHVRTAYESKNRIGTRALLQTLVEGPTTKALGSLGFGTFLALDGLYDSAAGYFKDAGVEISHHGEGVGKAGHRLGDDVHVLNRLQRQCNACLVS